VRNGVGRLPAGLWTWPWPGWPGCQKAGEARHFPEDPPRGPSDRSATHRRSRLPSTTALGGSNTIRKALFPWSVRTPLSVTPSLGPLPSPAV